MLPPASNESDTPALATPTTSTLPPIAAEDQARADFYALLARLYAAAPDTGLLHALASAKPWPEDADNQLAQSWNRLIAASAAMDAAAAEQEYTDLFVGVGKSEVNLHASHWITGFMMEKPLAALRTELALLGLARKPRVSVLEDHLSALCETMRLLIAGAIGRPPATVPVQRRFFEAQIAPWARECCIAISESPLANYYGRVSEFTRLFLAAERDSLAIE